MTYLASVDANVYDGKEHVVGTYYGKPLYRKDFKIISPSTLNAIIPIADISDLHMEKLISISFVLDRMENGIFISSGGTYHSDNDPDSIHIFTRNDELVYLTNAREDINCPVNIIIEYTKTTD